jgi:hypothetical protein
MFNTKHYNKENIATKFPLMVLISLSQTKNLYVRSYDGYHPNN